MPTKKRCSHVSYQHTHAITVSTLRERHKQLNPPIIVGDQHILKTRSSNSELRNMISDSL